MTNNQTLGAIYVIVPLVTAVYTAVRLLLPLAGAFGGVIGFAIVVFAVGHVARKCTIKGEK